MMEPPFVIEMTVTNDGDADPLTFSRDGAGLAIRASDDSYVWIGDNLFARLEQINDMLKKEAARAD